MAQKQSPAPVANQIDTDEDVDASGIQGGADAHDDVEVEAEGFDDEEAPGQRDHLHQPVTLHLSRSLVRKLRDTSREEGVTMEELASELVAEGVVLRAWEIVEKKATMRGGNASQGNAGGGQNKFNRGNSGNNGNNHNAHQQHAQKHFTPANKMAQKKLQRQTRQHANAMDLMSDKAAFIEYVRNQEKKRR